MTLIKQSRYSVVSQKPITKNPGLPFDCQGVCTSMGGIYMCNQLTTRVYRPQGRPGMAPNHIHTCAGN